MENGANKRIVLDTNVWVSGIVFGGTPERILRLFVDGMLDVAISEELMAELRRIIHQRFPLFVPKLNLVEASLREDAIWIPLGSRTIDVSRDPDDNKVIETAVIGKCDYIVSGDKDLLVLGKYENVVIVSPADFLGEVLP